jgi:hypothetical protein
MIPQISFSFRALLNTLILSLFILPGASFAQSLGSAGAFMRMGIGARAGSLGDAYVAAANGPEAVYWNPAALAISPSWQIAVTQRRYSFDRNFTFAGATIPLSARQALGFGWTGFRAGNIEARQGNTTAPDAYFSDDENALALAWGYHVNSWLDAGAGVKFAHQSLFNENASGYAASLGFLFKPTATLSFAAQWQDFLSSYRWSTGRQERLPHTLMLGMALQFLGSSLVTLDYHYSAAQNVAQQNNGAFRLGTEFRPMASLPLRLGYSQNAFNTGVGFETPVAGGLMKLDYNFAVQDGLNQEGHALSLGFEFGKRQRGSKERDSDFALVEEQSLAPNSQASFAPAKRDSSALNAHSNAAGGEQKQRARKVYITAASPKLIVYSEPKTSSKGLGVMRLDGRYEVVRKKGEWYQIKLAGKKLGWVKEESVKRVVAAKN